MRRTVDVSGAQRLIEPELRRWIAGRLGVSESELREDVSLVDDLAADSLDLLELGMDLELEFGVPFDQRHFAYVRTFGQLVAMVREQAEMRHDPAFPFVRAVIRQDGERQRAGIERVGWLTPYLASVVTEDALAWGRGARLEVSVAREVSGETLSRVLTRFEKVAARGIALHVARMA